MGDEDFPTPHDSGRRAAEWPRFHDIGIYMSAGDSLTLVGTAKDVEGLIVLFNHLALEWDRLLSEPTDWFFTDLAL